MTLDQLRYFTFVATLEHVGKAAKAAAISPSVISATISSLEEEMGCALFERRKNRIYLNINGKRLLEEAQKILKSTTELRSRINEKQSSLQGSFRIGASHWLASNILTPAWSKLQSKNPQIIADIISKDTGSIIADVLLNRLDMGLVFSPLKHQNLKERILYQGEFKVAVKKNHPLLKSKYKLKDISKFPANAFRALEGPNICEDHPVFEKFGIRPKYNFYYDSDAVVVKNLLASESWCFIPDLIVQSYARQITPIATPKDWDAPLTVSAIFNKARPINEAMSELLKLIEKSLTL